MDLGSDSVELQHWRSPYNFTTPRRIREPAEETSYRHVEAFSTRRCRAGAPNTGVTFLLGRRRSKVLLRGIAQGHIGRWYDNSILRALTVIVWNINVLMNTGHYHAEAWSDTTKSYADSSDVGVFVTVEETFDNNHRIVAQRGSQKGKFTFSAADSGQHRICVVPQNVPSGGGWLSSGVHGTVKFTLDLAIGETSKIESTDKEKVQTLVQKVADLNSRLQDVRREQVFQRVRHTQFPNSRSSSTDNFTGTRSRVPRPVRNHKRTRRPMDHHPACRSRCHLRMAALSSPCLLHQAETYVDFRTAWDW